MDKITQLAQVQWTMLLYLLLGIICKKRNILNDASEKSLAVAITDIVFPCMIFCAIIDSIPTIDWSKVGLVALISTAIYAGSYALGRLLFQKYPVERKAVMVFGMMISNAAFIGLPLVSGIWGAIGIFYTTIFMTISRCFIWTIGVTLFPDPERKNPVISIITNPNSIAMFLAAFYCFLPFQLPEFAITAIREVGSMSTVFCVVMVGYLACGAHLKQLVEPSILYYCLLRLIVMPLLIFFLLHTLQIDPDIVGVMTLLVSAPAPTLGSVFAARYHADKQFASGLVVTSTVFSMVTIPLLAMLYC